MEEGSDEYIDAAAERAVSALLDGDEEAVAAPSGGRTHAEAAAGAATMPNPMVAIATAMMEVTPRPTFDDFAGTVPANNPFAGAAGAASAASHTVFVTRHGARIDNGPDRDPDWLRKSGHGRRDDPHLSPSGVVAAEELAARLAASDVQLVHIVSSPHVRCVQTADAVAARLQLSIKVEPGIAEVGASTHALLSLTELAAQYPRVDAAYVPAVARADLRVEHGDSEAAARARAAALAVRARLAGPVLFVGHGASCLGIVEAFGASGYVGYTSLTRFEQRGGPSGSWVLEGALGDVSHLSDQATARRSAW